MCERPSQCVCVCVCVSMIVGPCVWVHVPGDVPGEGVSMSVGPCVGGTCPGEIPGRSPDD